MQKSTPNKKHPNKYNVYICVILTRCFLFHCNVISLRFFLKPQLNHCSNVHLVALLPTQKNQSSLSFDTEMALNTIEKQKNTIVSIPIQYASFPDSFE